MRLWASGEGLFHSRLLEKKIIIHNKPSNLESRNMVQRLSLNEIKWNLLSVFPCGAVQDSCYVLVCWWNPTVWPFKWQLLSRTFPCLFVTLNKVVPESVGEILSKVWPFKWKLLSGTFLSYCLFCCTRRSKCLSLWLKSWRVTVSEKNIAVLWKRRMLWRGWFPCLQNPRWRLNIEIPAQRSPGQKYACTAG